MNGSAIVMMLFGLGVLWGGFAVCVSIAQKRGKGSSSSSSLEA
ncbi:MetS family NSS transporter small subunit [Vulcanibacillus modesticaldus]|nr:MetS family NSS transporter small subunit [Vulcanibacillus modesticaldus]